jgi:hypothetical protein
VTSIALGHVYSRQIGARLRTNQGHDGMAFRQGVADNQPCGSARCTQTRTFMFDLDLSDVSAALPKEPD